MNYNIAGPILLKAVNESKAVLDEWLKPQSNLESLAAIDRLVRILDGDELKSILTTGPERETKNEYFHSWPNSSNIVSSEYIPTDSILKVSFRNGKTYSYHQVPIEMWQRFIESNSKGSFMHKEIRPNYTCTES